MKYNRIISGRFLSRPNRFIARCEIDGKAETVHVKIPEGLRSCSFRV